MKQLIAVIFIAILALSSVSCKKYSHGSSSMEGKWELTRVSAGSVINYPAGNGNSLEFTNSDYKIYKDGALDKSGTYILVPDDSVSESVCSVVPSGEYKNRIVYDGKTDSTKEFIQFSGNKLSLISGCYAFDCCATREYVRK